MGQMTTKDKLPPTVWVLISAAFVIAMGFGLIAPVLPLFAQDMAAAVFPDAEITATTIVVSAFAVFRLLWATPAGSLVGRLGEKRIYITGVLVVSISTALTAFAQNYWQLLLFRSLGGVGSVMFTVAAMGLLIKISPRHMRGRISALYGAMFLIGNMVGPVIGGLLAEFGIVVPFLLYAAALLIAALVMALKMPSTSPGREGAAPAAAPMTLREAFADRAYRANLPGLFAHGWSNFGVRVSVLPLFISYAVSRDAWVAGAAMAVFAVGNAAALPFSSRYADRGGRKPMIVLGAITAGVFTAALGYSTGYVAVFLLCLLAGIGTGMFNPAAQAVVADVVGHERSAGKVIASTQMITDIGSILGPMLAGLIVDFSGYGLAFLISGLILIAGALAWIGTTDTIERTHG
jgi:MFS family permease